MELRGGGRHPAGDGGRVLSGRGSLLPWSLRPVLRLGQVSDGLKR